MGLSGKIDPVEANVENLSGIRPALRIANFEFSDLQLGDKLHVTDEDWTILINGIALCDNIVGSCAFRNDYKAGDANIYQRPQPRRLHLLNEV